jgi:hypothetical protein
MCIQPIVIMSLPYIIDASAGCCPTEGLPELSGGTNAKVCKKWHAFCLKIPGNKGLEEARYETLFS